MMQLMVGKVLCLAAGDPLCGATRHVHSNGTPAFQLAGMTDVKVRALSHKRKKLAELASSPCGVQALVPINSKNCFCALQYGWKK